MILARRGRTSIGVALVVHVVVAAVFVAPMRVSWAASTTGDSPRGPKAGNGFRGQGTLPTDSPSALDRRLDLLRVLPVAGITNSDSVSKLVDGSAASAIDARGGVQSFRVELADAAIVGAVGVFGRSNGRLRAWTDSDRGRVEIMRVVDSDAAR